MGIATSSTDWNHIYRMAAEAQAARDKAKPPPDLKPTNAKMLKVITEALLARGWSKAEAEQIVSRVRWKAES